MEKSSIRRNNKTDVSPGDCVDYVPGQTGVLTGGESLEVWGLLKSNSSTSARNSSSQPIDSIWSSADKSGKPDLAWKSSGTAMSISHQNGSLEPWSGGLVGSSATWGDKKDGSGWGSPNSSPTCNAGTESWGLPTSTQQSWSQETRSTSGWEQQDEKFGSAWKKMQGVSDNCSQNKIDPATNVWSHLNAKSTGDIAWTAQNEEKPASQWGPGVRGNNGSQSNWENGFPSSNSASQTTSASWGWAGPSLATGAEQRPPHPTSSAASLPAPSTWAQAAGRGLNISNSNKPTGGSFGGGGGGGDGGAAAAALTSASGSSLSKEDLIAQLVNSKEGWGKTPIRQDTTWDLDEGSLQASCSSSRKVPSSATAVGSASASAAAPESTSSHMNACLVNNGTAIWESSRDSSSSASAGKLPSMAPIGCKDVGIKDRGASANVCQKPLSSTTAGSWVSQPTEFTEGLLAPTNGSQLSSLELNCDKSPSGGGGVWNMPEPVAAARSTSVPDMPWSRGSKDAVWESTRALSWSESAKSGSSSSDTPVLRHDSVSSCGWNLEKEPARIGESAGQSLLPRNDSGNVFDSSLSSHDQTQSWRAPGNLAASSSSVASQATSLNQGRAKLNEAKCDGIWQPQLSLSPAAAAAAAAEWTTDQADAGLSLWNPTSVTKPNAGWGDGSWSTKLKPPSSSAWNEGSDLYSGTEDRKLSGFETSSKSAQQSKPSLLQQLIDLGFHKEDVQAALLSNNMNIEQATSELLSNNNRKPAELDSSSSGQKCHGGQGMSGSTDLSSISIQEGSSFGHPGSILNHLTTTESHAQPPNSSLPRTSLQTPSSLANMTRSVTPNLQQPQQFASGLNTTGPVVPPHLSSQLSGRQPQQQQQQQVMQNQMLQQLKMAVQSGLMSHQPPSPMPSPALLLGLRQLVQLQNVLDWLLIQHQVLIQQNRNIGLVQPGQVEQLLVNIQSIKQQIVQQKWKIAQLQKQAAPSVSWPPADQYKDFPKDFAGLQVKDEPFNPWRVAPPPHPPMPAALPLLEGIGGGLPPSSVDLVTGSKSHSGLPLNPPFLTDSTWSMSAWPSHSSSVPATTTSLADSVSAGTGAADSKTSSDVDGSKAVSAAAASEMVASSGVASDAKQPNSSGAVLDIEEFIPGKPWQGPSMKNADDDPYLTPGSMSRNVFNMSSIIEPHILNALGRSNVGSTPDSHWLATSLGMTGSGANQNLREAAWTAGGPAGNHPDQPWAQSSFSKNTRPPPGLQQSFSRSVSWTPTAANRGEAWLPGSASNSLVLKNFPNQIDSTIVKALCQQHGPLQCFRYNPASRQVLVSYRNKEDAIQAKLALHSCVLANTPLMAEFVPDAEAARMLEQPDSMVASAVGNAWPQLRGSSLPKKMAEAPYWNGASSSFWEGYGGIWGPATASASAEEHSLPVHGDLLGSQ